MGFKSAWVGIPARQRALIVVFAILDAIVQSYVLWRIFRFCANKTR